MTVTVEMFRNYTCFIRVLLFSTNLSLTDLNLREVVITLYCGVMLSNIVFRQETNEIDAFQAFT